MMATTRVARPSAMARPAAFCRPSKPPWLFMPLTRI
jgi:hypothetical protein